MESIIEEFLKIQFPNMITELNEGQRPSTEREGGNTSENLVDFCMDELKTNERPRSARMSLTQHGAVSQETVTRVMQKFKEDIDFAYEDAIARHNNTHSAGIPTWFWCIFLWYASDNFIGYMGMPIFFYPMCLILTAIVVCY